MLPSETANLVRRALLLAGAEATDSQIKALAEVLCEYPDRWIVGAVERVATECRARVALADFLDRMADGRPGPEEAWGSCPRDEAATAVWTTEAAAAFWGSAKAVLDADGEIPARMAFIEAYKPLVASARRQAVPVEWLLSLGTDRSARVAAVEEAVRLGRISNSRVLSLTHDPEPSAQLRALALSAVKPMEERAARRYKQLIDKGNLREDG